MDPRILVLLIGITAIAAIWVGIWQKLRPNAYHRKVRGQSERALDRVRDMPDGAIIAYLRKMNPHAVEELVLDAASAAGHAVRRNHSYTCDGGVDGEIHVDGSWCLVQTKRYSRSIDPKHVADFSRVCAHRGQPGLFIHCGRTGRKSRDNATGDVRFVSGQALVALIKGESLDNPVPAAIAA
ncbi:restriction endonuclease [Sphingosinicella sp. BN140058]|uniref:restriction endonuclease n=1 Tax=Sphingosinicella sp. BN140058 TaxID=1892855 RepID=UPI0010106549|nr:restriction endonuclease [Sphingosinicella sp. BN140058]QAY80426.1 restriction endonuclease [Sphingosinicella sp. BN140058]